MFCPNCGKEAKAGDVFCGECGARLEEEKKVKKVVPKKKKQLEQRKTENKDKKVSKDSNNEKFTPKGKKIITAQIVVLVILLATFWVLGSRSGKPEIIVNQFVKDYNNHNWSAVYPVFHMEEDTFINEKSFVKTMEQSNTDTLSNATGGYIRNNQYVYRINKGSDYMMVYVAKSAKKTFLFFDKYEIVSVSDTAVQTSSVKIPQIPGVTVMIDGVKAEKTEGSTMSGYYAKVFAGTHKMTFSGADNMFEKDSYTFTTSSNTSVINQIHYSAQAKKEAVEALKGYLPAITEGKIKGKDTSSVSTYFSSEENADRYAYSLCHYTYYTGTDTKGLGDVNITQCEGTTSSSYRTVEDGVPVIVSGTRDYQAKDWSGSYQKQTLTIRGTAYMVKQNGKWVIQTVSYYYY